jgi:hypothetical protein
MTFLADLPPSHPLRNRALEGAWERVKSYQWRQVTGWKISASTYNDLAEVWTKDAQWTFDDPGGTGRAR